MQSNIRNNDKKMKIFVPLNILFTGVGVGSISQLKQVKIDITGLTGYHHTNLMVIRKHIIKTNIR